jgi:hypothetical protein
VVYRPRPADVHKLHRYNHIRCYRTLRVEKESVSKALVHLNHMMRLSAREKIIEFRHCKSFKIYAYMPLASC